METTLCYWDEKLSAFRHNFFIRSGSRTSELTATLLTVASLYDAKAREFVSVDRLMATGGIEEESPEITTDVSALLDGYGTFKVARKQPVSTQTV